MISFEHVQALALRAGESELTSWLLPVSIDVAIAAAVAVLLADSRAGRRPTTLTWLLLALGLASSLAANVASAQPTASARAVAAWPPIALALGIEVLAGLVRRNGASTDAHPMEPLERPAALGDLVVPRRRSHSAASKAAASGLAGTFNGTNRPAGRQPGVGDESAVALIRQLDEASENRQASRLEIQRALGCGGSRAARLARHAREPESIAPSR